MAGMRTVRKPLVASLGAGLAMGLVVAAAFIPSNAGGATRSGEGVADGGTLYVGVTNYDWIDPALTPGPNSAVSQSVFTVSWAVADATCALLFRYPVRPPPAVGYELVPEVAAGDPVVSRDGRTYTFTIRKGFRFSDGSAVTAANYVRAFQRVLAPAMDSPGREYLQDVSRVTSAGNRLIVRLTKKVPDFPARMTMPYLCPVRADLPIEPEGVAAPLAGSGPYYVAEFVRGRQVVLKRNPFYRRTRAHHVDELVIQVVGATVTEKVEAGELDVDDGVAPARLNDLYATYGLNQTRL